MKKLQIFIITLLAIVTVNAVGSPEVGENSVNKVYDGKPVSDPIVKTNSDGEIKFEYKGVYDDNSAYTEKRPIDAGNYTVRVTVAEGTNYKPAYATMDFAIYQATGKVEITEIPAKKYDGQPVDSPKYTQNSTGVATIEYKVAGTSDDTYTEEAPVKAGAYIVRVNVAEDRNYTAAMATADFAISQANSSITIVDDNNTSQEDPSSNDISSTTSEPSQSSDSSSSKQENSVTIDVGHSYGSSSTTTEQSVSEYETAMLPSESSSQQESSVAANAWQTYRYSSNAQSTSSDTTVEQQDDSSSQDDAEIENYTSTDTDELSAAGTIAEKIYCCIPCLIVLILLLLILLILTVFIIFIILSRRSKKGKHYY